ncbi:hypothetical protein H6F89_33525 [Cyanobacteria bacterium FACHB-63]|nr:hypothetical protein [Cyanobacteria bacterium FACHB-63]
MVHLIATNSNNGNPKPVPYPQQQWKRVRIDLLMNPDPTIDIGAIEAWLDSGVHAGARGSGTSSRAAGFDVL